MSMTLMYITNNTEVARIAEENGVDRIWIDLETLGKEERQKNMDSVKSHHTINDVRAMSKLLTKSELMVRVNPWNADSEKEIEEVISAGAERIMLPMWKTVDEVDQFLRLINRRTATTLLLETKEAVGCIDKILCNPFLDEIHIGLNDLHLSYGLDFMFELLTNGIVEDLCKKIKAVGVEYGFGGIASIGDGMLPAEKIIMEHYRLGSTRAILSRSFCDAEKIKDINDIQNLFKKNMQKLRLYENILMKKSNEEFFANMRDVKNCVDSISNKVREEKQNDRYATTL